MTKLVNAEQIITLFNHTFKKIERTELIGGAPEPLYLPVEANRDYAQVIFTHDYVASALHEIAHWCIAGKARRTQIDYGYWYAPEGRDIQQQRNFYKVEVKPQALEWIFSNACGQNFQISCDNFLTDEQAKKDEQGFYAAVKQQVQEYANNGLPTRAGMFSGALIDYYAHCSNPFILYHEKT